MSIRAVCGVVLGISTVSFGALADEPAPPTQALPDSAPEDPKVVQARELYLRGVTHVKRQEWSEALAAFERSSAVRPHATTTFNIGVCERALGNYTRARGIFQRALEQGAARPDTLAESLQTEAKALIDQIDRSLVRVAVTLEPAHASLAVDGRPLRRAPAADKLVLVAGVEPPGPGVRPPSGRFELVMNPGAHVITISRQGYADAVVRKSFAPGDKKTLDLRLERLPATLRVSANVEDALVSVSDVDVGPVPVEVRRPAGSYRVIVQKDGFEPYEASVSMRAGQESSLSASLRPEERALTQEWWFWAGAAAVVATGVVVTYVLTRPEPEPPPYDGGSTGWVVRPSGIRF